MEMEIKLQELKTEAHLYISSNLWQGVNYTAAEQVPSTRQQQASFVVSACCCCSAISAAAAGRMMMAALPPPLLLLLMAATGIWVSNVI